MKSHQRALESLVRAEEIALDKIADDNNEENRSAFMEIHKVLDTVRADQHRHGSALMKALRFLHLIP